MGERVGYGKTKFSFRGAAAVAIDHDARDPARARDPIRACVGFLNATVRRRERVYFSSRR